MELFKKGDIVTLERDHHHQFNSAYDNMRDKGRYYRVLCPPLSFQSLLRCCLCDKDGKRRGTWDYRLHKNDVDPLNLVFDLGDWL